MEEKLSGGETILLVSHQAELINRLCNRAIWIEHGKLIMDGPSAEVIQQYEASAAAD